MNYKRATENSINIGGLTFVIPREAQIVYLYHPNRGGTGPKSLFKLGTTKYQVDADKKLHIIGGVVGTSDGLSNVLWYQGDTGDAITTLKGTSYDAGLSGVNHTFYLRMAFAESKYVTGDPVGSGITFMSLIGFEMNTDWFTSQ